MIRLYRPEPDHADAFPRFRLRLINDNSMLITDRIVATDLLVYRPRKVGQIHAGYARDRWYVRPLREPGPAPMSRPFATPEEAAAAIRDGSWDLSPSPADRRPVRILNP